MTAALFPNSRLLIIEKRDENGRLDFSAPQPPTDPLTLDDIATLYYNATSWDGPPEGWAVIKAWLDERRWFVRACTWMTEPEWQTKARAAGWQPPRKNRSH